MASSVTFFLLPNLIFFFCNSTETLLFSFFLLTGSKTKQYFRCLPYLTYFQSLYWSLKSLCLFLRCLLSHIRQAVQNGQCKYSVHLLAQLWQWAWPCRRDLGYRIQLQCSCWNQWLWYSWHTVWSNISRSGVSTECWRRKKSVLSWEALWR